jgi:hypothetical protein
LWYIGEIGSEAKVGIILRGLKKKKRGCPRILA